MDRAPAGLLEREAERGVLERAVEEAVGGAGGVVVVEGHAGVGKTQLLRLAAELGETAGMRVLRARGSELDQAFGFGMIRQLFESTVRKLPDLFSGGAEPAAGVFSTRSAELNLAVGLFGSLQSLYWLAANLAERQPLLLLADDVHWADTASLRWFAFIAERIEDLPLLLVCATRSGEPDADQELLDVLTGSSVDVVRPAPLSADAVALMVHSRLPGAADAFTLACHRATRGNAFLLRELLGELANAGIEGSTADAPRVPDFGSERVGRAVRRRLRRLSDEAIAVANSVAVLGPPAPLEDVAALTELGAETVGEAADSLAAVNILTTGLRVDFVHPVVRSAVYEQIPPRRRERLHEHAAALMQARNAGSELVAGHLLRVPPAADSARVDVLRAAGREAGARGAADAAVRYLRRALAEPPPLPERGATLHELGLAEAADRQRENFEQHLRQAIATTEDAVTRSEIALDLGRAVASCGEFRGSVQIFYEALDGIADPEDRVAVELEAEMLAMAFHEFTCTTLAASHWQRRFRQLETGAVLAPATLAPLVVALAAARPPAVDAIALAERLFDAGGVDAPNSVLVGAVGNGLIYAGALSRAVVLYGDSIDAAARRGNRLTVAWQSTMRAKASLRLGNVRSAEADARLALDLFEVGSGEPGIAWCLAHLLDALLVRGALDEAQNLLEPSAEAAAAGGATLPVALLRTSLAYFHLARGQALSALREARAAGRLVSATISNPYCCDWRSAAARALSALGRGDEARALAEDELADARRYAVREAEGSALRTLGLVSTGSEGTELLLESVRVLEQAEGRLEHARSVLEYGASLRRSGLRTQAAGVLREALDESARMGASALADRAHEELVAAGGRPRRDRRTLTGPESLTAGEDRVARLAAAGLSNREIAQRQFVTVKAVQWHLRNVYRKLELTSRQELSGALGL